MPDGPRVIKGKEKDFPYGLAGFSKLENGRLHLLVAS